MLKKMEQLQDTVADEVGMDAHQGSYRYRFLLGAMQQNELAHSVRLLCIQEEVARLNEILTAWRLASARMVTLQSTEPGEPDKIEIAQIPQALHQRIQEIADDKLFQASFSAVPPSFGVVEVDRLVAPQRDVNLEYVQGLRARVPGNTVEELLEFCIGPHSTPPEWKVLQTAEKQVVFTSKSLDLRFLGGFRKDLSPEDIASAHTGGQPAEVISLLVGYGAAPINVYKFGTRLVLWNGFHRVVAMRMAGIRHIPVVVQEVANRQIQFPAAYLGLSREYLLDDPRPVLIKDFFDAGLTIELRVTQRIRVVKVSWSVESSVIPV